MSTCRTCKFFEADKNAVGPWLKCHNRHMRQPREMETHADDRQLFEPFSPDFGCNLYYPHARPRATPPRTKEEAEEQIRALIERNREALDALAKL